MISLPGSKRTWAVSQASDLFGNIAATKNIDFDRAGYLALAKQAMVLYSQGDNSSFTAPIAFAADNSNLYVITSSGIFKVSLSSDNPVTSQIVVGGTPNVGFYSDVEFFQAVLHVTDTSSMSSYNPGGGGVWTSRVTGLSSSYPHPMCRHGGRQTLVVADGNVLRQYDTSYTRDTVNELTIPAEYVIEWIPYRQNYLYIGTRNIAGGNAALFVWAGAGVGNDGQYDVQADWIYSGCIYQSYIAAVTSAGQLLAFNGSGFNELANFPIYYTDLPWTSSAATTNLIGNVASRGMAASGDDLLICVNGAPNLGQGEPQGKYLLEMPSGLWKFDPAVGLYHKAGANYKTHQTLQPTEIDSNRLVLPSAHNALTGDAVYCASQNGITGVTGGQTYYAIVETGATTALQLALSRADAFNGRSISISGTPNSLDLFAFATYDSMGGGQITNAGPVFVPGKLRPNSFFSSEVIFGANAIDNTGTSHGALCGLGLGRNRGYFLTPKIPSANVLDTWQRIVNKFAQLQLGSQEIILKYRSTERFGTPNQPVFSGSLTFTSSTTFTVDTTIKDFKSAEVGDEVEFITGAASGYLAHITAIDKTTSTYIVTIDETLPVTNGDKTDCIANNWTKGPIITDTSKNNGRGFDESSITANAKWVQFKVELRGAGVILEDMTVINAPNQPPI
jgi:hypothetical protein